MTATTRSEMALVRPFSGLAAVDDALDKVRLLVNAVEYEAGPVVLAEELLNQATLTLLLPAADEIRDHVAKTQVPAVDCGVVVIATGRTNRVSAVLLQDHLRLATYDGEFTLRRETADLVLNDKAGFTLTVAVALLADLTPAPLRPHMAGTWLARRDFAIAPEADERSFSPEHLTDQVRQDYGLPAGVLRYIQVEDVLDEENLADAVHVYVDPEVLNLMLASPGDALAVQLQTELAIQATEAVATSIVRELCQDGAQPTPELLEPYPSAKRFFETLSRTLSATVADALYLADGTSSVFRAHLESAFDVRNATVTALKER